MPFLIYWKDNQSNRKLIWRPDMKHMFHKIHHICKLRNFLESQDKLKAEVSSISHLSSDVFKVIGFYGTVGNDDLPSRKQLLERSLLLMPARSGDLSWDRTGSLGSVHFRSQRRWRGGRSRAKTQIWRWRQWRTRETAAQPRLRTLSQGWSRDSTTGHGRGD